MGQVGGRPLSTKAEGGSQREGEIKDASENRFLLLIHASDSFRAARGDKYCVYGWNKMTVLCLKKIHLWELCVYGVGGAGEGDPTNVLCKATWNCLNESPCMTNIS
jgi:hypothetical protein